MQKSRTVAIDVVIKVAGAQTLTFVVAGFDSAKLPAPVKK